MSSASPTDKKRVLVPIATKSEEFETACIIDILRKFGAEVRIASINGKLVCEMNPSIEVVADTSIEEAAGEEWDLVALPGSKEGAAHLQASETLKSILERQNKEGKLIGAICASPAMVLASHGLIGKKATCYPYHEFEGALTTVARKENVVVDGNIITSRGPGTALEFALQLGEQLYGKEKADEIAGNVHFRPGIAINDDMRLKRNAQTCDDEVTSRKKLKGSRYDIYLFDQIIVPTLENLGWTIRKAARDGDFYYISPDVFPGNKRTYRSRVNVRSVLENCDEWEGKDEALKSCDLYDECCSVWKEMKSLKRVEISLDTVLEEAKSRIARNEQDSRTNDIMFNHIIVPTLKNLGWSIITNKYDSKINYIPPDGFTGNKRYRTREKVLSALENCGEWEGKDEALKSCELYNECCSVWKEMISVGQTRFSLENVLRWTKARMAKKAGKDTKGSKKTNDLLKINPSKHREKESILFDHTVVPTLKKLGWNVRDMHDTGTCYIPPENFRGKNQYLSTVEVLSALRNSNEWEGKYETLQSFDLYNECRFIWERMKDLGQDVFSLENVLECAKIKIARKTQLDAIFGTNITEENMNENITKEKNVAISDQLHIREMADGVARALLDFSPTNHEISSNPAATNTR